MGRLAVYISESEGCKVMHTWVMSGEVSEDDMYQSCGSQ